jgi:uncharacterized protein YndB with AHSA1/START domain
MNAETPSSLRLTKVIHATPEQVFAAFTEEDQLKQ